MANSDLVAMLKEGERLLEAAFSDETPGTDNIGPDIDNHMREFNSQNFYPSLMGKDRLNP